jgi:hypothetical protein
VPSRLRRTLLLLALPLLAAGCGSSGGGDASTSTLLKDTFSGGQPVNSGNLDLTLGVQTQGLKSLTGPLAFKLAGPFSSLGAGKLPKFDFDLDIAAGNQTIQAGAVSLGDTGYLKFNGKAYSLSKALFDQFKNGYERSAAQSKSKSSVPSLKALGVNPSTWLTNPQQVGKADVGGAQTFHITSGVNVQRFLADINSLLGKAKNLGGSSTTGVPQSLSPQVQATIERSVKDAKVDIYTGVDDHALRRLALSVDLAVPKDAQKQAGGLKSGELRLDLTIADLNKDQTIQAPTGARPFSELQSQLAALQGSTSSSSSTTSSSSSSSATATATQGGGSPKYLQCVQKAGTDIAQVQKCAGLVNGG